MKRFFPLTASIVFGLALLALWGGLAQTGRVGNAAAVRAPTTELRVCPAGPPTCDHATVQAAVDAANDGDVIKVATGTYSGVNVRPRNDVTTTGVVTQVVYISKSVTIRGGYTAGNWVTPDPEVNLTTLDAQGQGRVLYITSPSAGSGQAITPTIEGLRITGGDATGMGGEGHSGEDAGGGVYIVTATATINNNWVFGNHADTGLGGGIHVQSSDAMLSGNTVFSNTANYGGGLGTNDCDSEWRGPTIDDNIFTGNTADGGGGLNLTFCCDTTLKDNIVTGNTANSQGGGLGLFICGATLDGNTISANNADWGGGGLSIEGPDFATLTNNVIADNQVVSSGGSGSGMWLSGAWPRLSHNTIARNSGGDGSGIFVGDWANTLSDIVMTNTIVSSHTIGISVTGGNTVTVNSILWHNTPVTLSQSITAIVSVQNEVVGDPDFLDPDAGDYHIGSLSTARDAGVDAGVYDDIDGQMRPMNWGYDLGADESGTGLSLVKRPSAVFVNSGQALTYTLVVTSAGTEAANNVVLTDTLDGWQKATDVIPSGLCTIVDGNWGGAVVCSPGAMVTGTTFVATLTAQISSTVPQGQAMVNAVEVTADETANSAQAATYAQDCHARINDETVEYTTVQAAVDAADSGDVVKVAGVCVGAPEGFALRQLVYLDKSITLRGGYSTSDWATSDPEANPTTLDALGQGRVLYVGGPVSATIENLQMVGGDAAGLGEDGWDTGGGIYATEAELTLNKTQVLSNTAFAGGGIWVEGGTSTLNKNLIADNTAAFCGGLGVDSEAATLVGNTISTNATWEWSGGGVCIYSDGATLRRNTITANSAARSGGGLLVLFGGDVAVINNVIADNQASFGGNGVRLASASAQLLHNTIVGNSGGDGSGVLVSGDDPVSSLSLVNTILVSHSVGISVAGGSDVTVNGVLWYNTPLTVFQSPTATVTLQNEFVGDPLFDVDGYHLTADSPAIDVGVDAGVRGDIDLHFRPIGLGFDLGADEVLPPPGTADPDEDTTLIYTDTLGGETTLDIPAGAVTTDTLVYFTPTDLEEEEAPAGLAFGGRSFELEAYQDGELVSSFATTVTVVIEYTDEDVAGVFEDTLIPHRWTGSEWEEIGERDGEGYLLEPDINRLTLYLLGFSKFGHMGTGIQSRLYLPLMLKD